MQTETEARRWKRGDVREDGKVFWQYNPHYRDGERWLTPEKFAAYREKNKAYFAVRNAAYQAANREAIRARKAAYRAENREKEATRNAAYYAANREAIRARRAAYRKANREVIRARKAAYKTARYNRDPLFALKHRLSARTRLAFARIESFKPASTESLLNCVWGYAKAYIEKQFTADMAWGNRGEWHIDHIIPLASAYDAYTTAMLCDIHNLRPMPGPENLSKSATWHPPEYSI